MRLKDKLGNRSNASSELELDGTWAQRLGDEGRGVRTIIEMVAATRLDCVLGSTSLMRRALAEASWHVAHRSAFGSAAGRQAADAERRSPTSRSSPRPPPRWRSGSPRPSTTVDDPHEAALRRIALPLAKFWVCKRTPAMVAEALECLGGNGYVEESGMPLLFRESPLNSVWEGSGNVNALDVLRALGPASRRCSTRGSPRSGRPAAATRGWTGRSRTTLELARPTPPALEGSARRLAGRMAACLQGSLLVRYAPPAVADAFCASRLGTTYDGTSARSPRRPAGDRRAARPRPWPASDLDIRTLPVRPHHRGPWRTPPGACYPFRGRDWGQRGDSGHPPTSCRHS